MSIVDKLISQWSITELHSDNQQFPGRLKTIPDNPQCLYLGGAWEWLDRVPCVAIVGTRYPSEWGQNTAFELASTLADLGWGVISGLALGIDTAAHKGALSRGGLTGATLPGGLHRLYPPQNIDLAEDIIRSGGFLMSEYAPDIEPAAEYFKARDRLQSGLVSAVVVVETEPDGGTMHTARFAVEHDRHLLVFLAPQGIQSVSAGNRILEKWPHTRMVSSINSLVNDLSMIIKSQG